MSDNTNTISNKNKAAKKTKNKWIKAMKIVVLVMIIFTVIIAAYSVVILSKDYSMEELALNLDMNSTVYDREGNEIRKLYSVQNREIVKLDTLPEHLKNAFIYTEDKRFESHFGIDPQGIARAIWVDVKTMSLAEGASTITQQLAKNAFLTNDKNITRKLKEALIAIDIERNYTKDQILEMYLNRIYFGHGAYGVQAAAELYFNKNASELNIAESAMLASLPKAPNTYSPFRNPDKAKDRRTLVIALLKEHNIISSAEAEEANKAELVSNHPPVGNENKYQTYIDYIVDEAIEKYNLTEDEVYRGGYHIYTNLDLTTQVAMEETITNDELFNSEDSKDRKVEAGMVSIDPNTGGIVAMVGGREYAIRGLNRATVEAYQPGSTMKPLAVYAPAIEKGDWHPYDTVEDKPMTFSDYEPSNYGNRYYGTVTLETALTKSLNIPAVYLLNDIGVKTGYNFVESTGINLHQGDRNLSLALGGLTMGTSPLLMAQAYSAFANDGKLIEAHAITRIEDHARNVVGEVKPVTKTIMSPRTSYYLTKMMEKVVTEGTGTAARIGRPVAGKTGSTQADIEGIDGNRDAWFVGYTPDLVTAVHIGYDKTDKDHYLTSGGSRIPAHMFSLVMKKALQDVAAKEFDKPEGVEPLRPPFELNAVTDLSASFNHENHEIQLTWGSIDPYNRANYRVYRISEDTPESVLIGETQETSFVDKDIPQQEPSRNIEGNDENAGLLSGLFEEIADDQKSMSFQYYVVAYDINSGEEAEPSNMVSVSVSLKSNKPDPDETEPVKPDNGEENGNGGAGDRDRVNDGNGNGNGNGDGNDNGNGNGNGAGEDNEAPQEDEENTEPPSDSGTIPSEGIDNSPSDGESTLPTG